MKTFGALLALVCTSCSSNIVVVDQAGRPVPDAAVVPLSRSFSWPAKRTDDKGGVFIHQDIPTIDSIRVYKTGYRTSPAVNYNLPKPIKVVLEKK